MKKHDLTKRYWLFIFYDYYPGGGLNDIALTSDSLQEIRYTIVKKKGSSNFERWGHIQLVDTKEGKRISKRELSGLVKGEGS